MFKKQLIIGRVVEREAIPAHIPKGIRYEMVSISLAIDGRVSPKRSEVTAQACSTT